MAEFDTEADATLAELRAQLAELYTSAPEARRTLRQHLVDSLQTGPPTLRAFAAEGLGRIGDDHTVPLLIDAVKDPHPLVQWHAAHALRTLTAHGLISPTTLAFDDGDAFQAWQRALLDRVTASLQDILPTTRQDAAATLVALDAAGSIPALIAVLPDPDPATDALLRHSLSQIVGREPARLELAWPELQKLLRHPDPHARRAATALMADLGAHPWWHWLAPLLHDVDPQVRAGAALALGRLGELAASVDLQALLVDDIPAVRSAAAWALGALGDPYATPALLQSATDEDATVRHAVIGALATIATPESLPVLLTALATDDPVLRYQAAVGLGRLGDRRAVKPLLAVRRDRRMVAGTTVADAAAAATLAIRGRPKGRG